MKTDSELLHEAIEIFIDLVDSSDFYIGAIEIDSYASAFDGECFKARIDSLLKDFESKRETKQ